MPDSVRKKNEDINIPTFNYPHIYGYKRSRPMKKIILTLISFTLLFGCGKKVFDHKDGYVHGLDPTPQYAVGPGFFSKDNIKSLLGMNPSPSPTPTQSSIMTTICDSNLLCPDGLSCINHSCQKNK